MELGDTFYPLTPVVKEHLWIVVTDPQLHHGQLAMVNVTSHRHGVDESCLLNEEDHPFIRHPSVIAYQFARVAGSADLDNFVRKNYLQMRARVIDEVLGRIQAGALASTLTPRGVKAMIRAQLGID